MFAMTLGPTGYEWVCSIGECAKSGTKPNANEAAADAIAHRDMEHPATVWSATRHRAANVILDWLGKLEGSDFLTVSPIQVMDLVNDVADALGEARQTVQPSPARAAEDWGRDPMTLETMHDIRLIESPQPTGPTRNWTTNHQVRWSVGEPIQSPPEGRGCQVRGARVGEDVEVCALPGHNPANIKHVFAIGERVTRIAHN